MLIEGYVHTSIDDAELCKVRLVSRSYRYIDGPCVGWMEMVGGEIYDVFSTSRGLYGVPVTG